MNDDYTNDNKNILFDLTAMEPNATGSKFHGAAEYAKNIFWCLTNCFGDIKLDCIYSKDSILDTCKTIAASKLEIKYLKIHSHSDISEILSTNKYSAFFSALAYDYCDIVLPPNTKFVYAIHGLRITEKPFDRYMLYYDNINLLNLVNYIKKFIFSKKNAKEYINRIERLISVTSNRCIITASNHSKYSILHMCKNVKAADIKVYHAPTGIRMGSVDCDTENSEDISRLGITEKKYFLLVSCNRWIKNTYRAVKAFDLLYSENSLLNDYKVVLLGITDKCKFVKKIKNKEKFVLEGYVDDAFLQELYKKAFAFVYPSLNEGYGYPPIESMKHNTACLCSTATSIIEVCQDAACYFNPYDIQETQNRIYQILDDDIRNTYIRNGRRRYKEVNEKQKQDLYKICERILDK